MESYQWLIVLTVNYDTAVFRDVIRETPDMSAQNVGAVEEGHN